MLVVDGAPAVSAVRDQYDPAVIDAAVIGRWWFVRVGFTRSTAGPESLARWLGTRE